MKTKIFLVISLVMGLFLASCDDDDFTINNNPILDESSVVTGSADVTATTATFHGTIKGLSGQNEKAYTVGFYYGTDENALGSNVNATFDGENIEATVSGLTEGTVIYYQAFVTLQSSITYKGEIKSLVTTDATVATKAAASVDYASAVLAGSQTGASADATCGVVIATTDDVEAVRAGLIVAADEPGADFAVDMSGLRPAQTYYYAAYVDLGSGIIYGDVESFTTDDYEFDLDNDLVDLGLSVKWARFNLGAKEASGFGGLFGFGDLTGVNNTIDREGYADADTYKTEKDVAFASYQGKVTLPTADDFEELFTRCSAEWTEQDGIAGYTLTGPNGNSIFLPAAGSRTLNDVEGRGTSGYYLTGSINPTNSEYALAYEFNNASQARATIPVYQAAAVRPVSTAKNVPFVRELLHTRWYLDNGQDGKQHVFPGPFTQFGFTDSWATVTNGQPNIEQDIYWEMGTDNGWIGYTYGQDYGYMEFAADGKVTVLRKDAEDNETTETGTYTVDETEKVLDIDIEVLAADTWLPVKSGKLKILALDEDGLRIALPADDNTYAYSLNYYSEAKAAKDEAIDVSLIAVGSDWGGTWGTVIESIAPESIFGTYTSTYQGAINGGAMVFTLDFVGLASRFPNAIVTIDEIKADGTPVTFDANRFYYGDLEGNGNFRVQLFNIYGNGNENNMVPESPFSNNTAPLANEPAMTCTTELEFTYTIRALDNATFTPQLITINPSWGGSWDFSQGATFTVSLAGGKFTIDNQEFDITLNSSDTGVDYTAGSIMTFINVNDLMNYFPGTHSTLDALIIDGNTVTIQDPSKIFDTSDGGAYRLELWNQYGITSQQGCGVGTPVAEGDNQVVKELGFSTSMEIKFTVESLFRVPQW